MTRNRNNIGLLLLLAGIAVPALGQTLASKTYLMRAENTTADSSSDVLHTCILVYADGKYRVEHSLQGDTGKPDDKVYLDTLPDEMMKDLLAILADAKFQAVPAVKGGRGVVQDVDSLFVMVPREHNLQSFGFWTTKERKPYQVELKPLQVWMKEVMKRKVPQAKKEAANNCDPPEVIYRTVESEKTTLHPE